MPINRLHIPHGEVLPSTANLVQYVIDLALRDMDSIVELTPGEYDLTPPAWTGTMADHDLTVHDEHDATYRLVPRASHVRAITLDARAGSSPKTAIVNPSVQSVRLPRDTALTVIGTPITDNPIGVIQLWDVILHTPESIQQA